MYSTICLLFFTGFILWMNTSKRISWPDKNKTLVRLALHPPYSRYLSGALLVTATLLSIRILGTGSGLFASVVILMMTGSLCVLFFPFRYFGIRAVMLLYLCSVVLELVFS